MQSRRPDKVLCVCDDEKSDLELGKKSDTIKIRDQATGRVQQLSFVQLRGGGNQNGSAVICPTTCALPLQPRPSGNGSIFSQTNMERPI